MTHLLDLALAQLAHLQKILVANSEAEQFDQVEHGLFLNRFDELIASLKEEDVNAHCLGQEIMTQIFMRYPQIAHLVPRELLWFFGGECLHFMPDDEIAIFQQLEELQYQAIEQGTVFNWLEEKQRLLPKVKN